MAKYCSNCGNELGENQQFCGKCGSPVNSTSTNNTTIINNYNTSTSNIRLPERNIAVSVILSFVTCGIYGIYWFVKMTDEAKIVSNKTNASGVLAIVYSLLTCGIYMIYWNYKMGQNMYEAGKIHNKDIADNSVLYLVLSIFGFSIVNYCLIQNDLNKFSN